MGSGGGKCIGGAARFRREVGRKTTGAGHLFRRTSIDSGEELQAEMELGGNWSWTETVGLDEVRRVPVIEFSEFSTIGLFVFQVSREVKLMESAAMEFRRWVSGQQSDSGRSSVVRVLVMIGGRRISIRSRTLLVVGLYRRRYKGRDTAQHRRITETASGLSDS